MLNDIKSLGIPTAGYHLDLFFGLDRASYVLTDPYFELDYFFSTDGGHDKEWEEAGVNHHYMPPGVYHEEAYDALPNPKFSSDIAFVGSVNYAHAEHAPVRAAMLRTVQKKYGRRFQIWPKRQAIRGHELTELYASVKVVIGDSCLAGKVRGYFSDRCMETLGRGGFLIHPYVPGILNSLPDLVTYEAGNWDALIDRIDHYLASDAARESNRKSNAEWVRNHHTYKHRMQEILEVVGLA